MIKIVLTEEDFRELVAGRVSRPRAINASIVTSPEVEIILSDIGWERMTMAIAAAMGKQVRDD